MRLKLLILSSQAFLCKFDEVNRFFEKMAPGASCRVTVGEYCHPRLRTAFQRMSIALYLMPLPSVGFLVPTCVLGARPKPILWPETGLVAVIAGRVRGGFEELDRVNRRTRLAGSFPTIFVDLPQIDILVGICE